MNSLSKGTSPKARSAIPGVPVPVEQNYGRSLPTYHHRIVPFRGAGRRSHSHFRLPTWRGGAAAQPAEATAVGAIANPGGDCLAENKIDNPFKMLSDGLGYLGC